MQATRVSKSALKKHSNTLRHEGALQVSSCVKSTAGDTEWCARHADALQAHPAGGDYRQRFRLDLTTKATIASTNGQPHPDV